MDYPVAAVKRGADRLGVGDIAHPSVDGRKAARYSRARAHEYPELVPGGAHRRSHMRADKAGGAGDDDAHLAECNSDTHRYMRARIHVLTLGVRDLERSLAFYRALGLQSPGVMGTEWVGDDTTPGGAIAVFELEDGLLLSLYGREDLEKDANATFDAPGRGEFSIGHLVGSKDKVDAILAAAVAAGATLTEEPHDRPWDIYSGYFRDPDGHLWEIIWNPRRAPAPP